MTPTFHGSVSPSLVSCELCYGGSWFSRVRSASAISFITCECSLFDDATGLRLARRVR